MPASKIGKLLINAPGGDTIALDQVANIRLNSSPSGFLREGASRYSIITAEVSEGSIATIRGEVAKRLAEFQFPAGFHAELLTPEVALAMDNPGILAGMAAVVIGLFLAALACIGGWSRTSLLFLLAPAALLGAIAIPLAAGFIGAGHVAGFAVLVTLAFSGLLVGAESDGVFKYLGQDDAASAAKSVHAASGNLAALAMILGLAAATVIVGEIEGLELFHSMAQVIIAGFPTLLIYLLVIVPAAVRSTAIGTRCGHANPSTGPRPCINLSGSSASPH